MQIEIVHGSILDVETEAIVNAANSHGTMGGGVAGVIRRVAGPQVEREARKQAPIPVGHAILTSGGNTRFRFIVHAPTMPEPAMRIPAINVGLATKAALKCADEAGLTSIALPGMGTGVGGVSPEEAAQHMMREIRSFQPRSLRRVILVDIDPAMVQAWREQLVRDA
ncbi:MAG: macro domain-containing protein [Nitrospirae bacterium]|nr:MAG: macro domain-containing protein [Nitrospirota bacterium]